MKPLTLRAIENLPAAQRLNLFGLTPERLRDLSVAEIGKLPLGDSRDSCELGSWFRIADGSRESLRLEGDLRHCDYVGGQLKSGEIEVEGSIGHQAGYRMSGGKLIIRGQAGHYTCSGMLGGEAVICGDVGEYLGGASDGSTLGMRGGTVVVQGDADRWAAARMRRGTIVIHGRTAAGLAMRMVAGSVVCCGPVDGHPGCGMRRGTLLMLGTNQAPTDVVGFSRTELAELSFLALMIGDLRRWLPVQIQQQMPESPSHLPRRAMRCVGDRTIQGLGELIWIEPPTNNPTNHHQPH
jgi:formylmethanofuran dehydrogenase subunit C